jgi:hypothetical protein
MNSRFSFVDISTVRATMLYEKLKGIVERRQKIHLRESILQILHVTVVKESDYQII